MVRAGGEVLWGWGFGMRPSHVEVDIGIAGDGNVGGRAGKGRGSAAPPGTAGGSKLIIPYVGPMKDVEDVELSDPSLGLDKQLEETEHLLKAFEDALKNHEPLIAKAVAKTEERCAGSKREAVEAATLAAIQTTELRMQSELRAAVADN